MEQVLTDSAMWAGVLGGVAIGAFVSRVLRRDPWWLIGVKAAGFVALVAGLGLARAIGEEAMLAAALTSGGVVLAWGATGMYERRSRRAREPSTPA